MRPALLLLALLLLALLLPWHGARADDTTEIGHVNTALTNLGLTRSHRVVVERFTDPEVPGVACHVSQARTGGIAGMVGVAEDAARFSLACTATGGRNGHAAAEDGSVVTDLSVPKAMGGPGKPGTSTPEHLFAAGYAADAKAAAAVSIGPREGGGFGLAVALTVEDPSLPQAELEALATEAHAKICPYSHATRGNVDVSLVVKGG
jgi:osmotically inducible protein OsmC